MNPSSSLSPRALSVTLDVMDRAAALAQHTFEEQGLPWEAQCVAQVVAPARPDAKDLEEIAFQAYQEDLEKELEAKRQEDAALAASTSPISSPSKRPRWASIALRLAGALAGGFLLVMAGTWLVGPISAAIRLKPADVTDASAVSQLRSLVAIETTQELQAFFAHSGGSENAWSQAMRARGRLTITDRVGRPEVQWSGVSAQVCRAMVEDVYQTPSGNGIVVRIDGKNEGVSCDGPTHIITLTPHL
jgi:hypothetical protein